MPQDLTVLKNMRPYWEYVGFEDWRQSGMEGLHRRESFAKDGLMGKVAEFHVKDYIIWTHRGATDEELILQHCKPETDVMKHRFLLLCLDDGGKLRTKSLWLGLGGYVEVLRHRVGSPPPAKFKDLVFFVDKGFEYAAKGVGLEENLLKGG